MTKPYTQSHPLRWPLTDLTVVTVSTLPLGLLRQLRGQFHIDDKDESKRDFHGFEIAAFKAATGLSDEQRGDLSQPDLNSLAEIVEKLNMKPSYELVEQHRSSDDEFHLLVPVVDVMRGQEPIQKLQMVPPTVRLTDSMRELGGFARERELVAVCTNITPLTVDALHMPDWLALQTRINDFLVETADYFPLQTSNA